MIPINEEWWIDKDQYQFIVQRKTKRKTGKKEGEEYFVDQTYHPTHESVIKRIGDLALGEAVNHNIMGCVELIEGFKKEFSAFKNMKK